MTKSESARCCSTFFACEYENHLDCVWFTPLLTMKRRIDNFFKPICADSNLSRQEDIAVNSKKRKEILVTEEPKADDAGMSGNSFIVQNNDIGKISNYFAAPNCDSKDLRIKFFNNLFVPLESYSFPVREMNKKKLRFQYHWLKKWKWLTYSKIYDGAFCKYCVFFSGQEVGKGSHQNIGSLVAKPFIKWKDATEKFNEHQATSYHKKCQIYAENFSNIMSGGEDIACKIDSNRRREIQRNREALVPIIETIIFCGQQEISLRGDEDHGSLILEKAEKNDGNFRALIRFRANSGDENLKQHIINCKKNASYFSPTIQNEILDICGKIIQKNIVDEANKSEYFTILADETLDVSGVEQFSLCVRYVNDEKMLCDHFLGFVPVFDLSAKALTDTLLNECQNLGLEMSKLVGQGYDGASNMRGELNGVQANVKKIYPKAIYVHCANHRLNLALSSALSISFIRNCNGTINEISNLFRNNSYAGNVLKNNIKCLLPESKKGRLLKLCETRFIERHDAIIVFVELFDAIVSSLQEISEESHKAVSTTAELLISAIEKSSFLIALLVCEKLLSFTLPLSLYLQNQSHDLISSLGYAKSIKEKLQNIRNGNFETYFNEIYNAASVSARNNFDAEIRVPRTAKKQTVRDNPPFDTPEEYYRRAIFLPCLDQLISQLEIRFDANEKIFSSIEIIIPKYASPEKVNLLENLKIYFENEVSDSLLKAEYILWCAKWESVEKKSKPKCAMDALVSCDENFFPNIYRLIKILCTLPVSTASVERSFSTMKRIKTFLRNRTGHDRLTNLALISVHRSITINTEDVLNTMASKSRKINLLI